MSMPTALATTPFAEDQLSEIHRLVSGATAEQRLWLSGYVAGFQAATEAPAAPAAPPAAKAKLTILYATESGNAEALAGAARKSAARLGFAAKTVDMMDTSPEQIAGAENLLVIASTWGEGDPPQRAEGFLSALMADGCPAPHRPALRGAGAGRPRLCEFLRDRPADRRSAGGAGRHAHRSAHRLRPGFSEAGGWLDRRDAARDRAGSGTGRSGDPCRFRAPGRARRIAPARSMPRSPRRSTSTAAAPTSRRTMSNCRWPARASPMSRAIRLASCRATIRRWWRRCCAGRAGRRRGAACGADRTLRHHHADAGADRRLRRADRRRGVARPGGGCDARDGIPARPAVHRSAGGGAAQADGRAIDLAAAAVAAAAITRSRPAAPRWAMKRIC